MFTEDADLSHVPWQLLIRARTASEVDSLIASATPSPAAVFRTASVTSAPAEVKARAVSIPRPEDAPVTIARTPVRSTPRSTSSAVLEAVKEVEISRPGVTTSL